MSTNTERSIRSVWAHELEVLQGEWVWFLVLGIALIVLGTIAIGSVVLATFATVVMIGVLLIMGGIVQAVGAFWSRKWSGFFLSVLSGVLYLVLGLLFLCDPGD